MISKAAVQVDLLTENFAFIQLRVVGFEPVVKGVVLSPVLWPPFVLPLFLCHVEHNYPTMF